MTALENTLAALVMSIIIYGAGILTGIWIRECIEAKQQAAFEKVAAEAISKIEITNKTIQQKVIERIKTEKVYTECRQTPEMMDLINRAYQ